MMQEKAGVIAGAIWNVLDQVESMSAKDLKKAVKLKTEKELYLGLGWLLREDKLNITGDEKDPVFSLKK
ncbi:winged helix-turn-helix domain-containing protein [Bacteroides sp. OF04-15BH]|uniref:winged helix-turn-helix domain-containing protein n=1 Tax=Bacteroides sp. OF04-15BH TaxID=2292281 RepID=UPI0018F58A9D|nr:winged helix-turn-helix domain-containing protein [Bacteroides sp. OF04-15BH]